MSLRQIAKELNNSPATIMRRVNESYYQKRLTDNTNIYIYNPNILSWRLPYRSQLSSYYIKNQITSFLYR